MKQLYPRSYSKLNYVADQQFIASIGAGGTASSGGGASGCPVLLATTARNLSFVSRYDLGHPAFSVDVLKNGSPTGISISSPLNSTTVEEDLVNSASYVAGDILNLQLSGTGTSFALAYTGGSCLELEASENQYGINAHGPDKVNNTEAWYGGIFGNGGFQRFASYAAYSNTKSIAGMDGTITRLGIHNFGGDLGVGTWTAWLIKNKIPQDGSGASVDTRVSVTGATAFAVDAFSLPFVRGDVVEVIIQYLGPGTSLQIWHLAATITVTPANASWFMLTGGSNNVIPNASTGWVWNRTEQLDTPEDNEISIVGPGGLNLYGMYTERTTPPGVGKNWTDTLRSNYLDTVLSSVMADGSNNELVVATVNVPGGAIINIQNVPFNTPPSGANFYWGLAAEVVDVNPAQLIITKSAPSDPTKIFTIDVGGGLIPTSVDLRDGESTTYVDVTPGTGYSVSETTPGGWEVPVITVSNGSPAGDITIADGETVTVTVTNALTCPAVVSTPRIDGLPYVPFSP